MQASFTLCGTSKSGWPIERLIGSFIFAARSNTLRMPLVSKLLVRSAIQDEDMSERPGERVLETGHCDDSRRTPVGPFAARGLAPLARSRLTPLVLPSAGIP